MRRWLAVPVVPLVLCAAAPAWADFCEVDWYDLGVIYATGENGARQDYAEAARFFGYAARKGDSDAQLWLGRLYYGGKGVREDHVQAYKWLTLASSRGDAVALMQRDIVAAEMTSSQIAQAEALAAAWKPTICQ
jgi:TPR repeat protein